MFWGVKYNKWLKIQRKRPLLPNSGYFLIEIRLLPSTDQQYWSGEHIGDSLRPNQAVGGISALSLGLIPQIITSYELRHYSSVRLSLGILLLSKNQVLYSKITLNPDRGKRKISNKGIKQDIDYTQVFLIGFFSTSWLR